MSFMDHDAAFAPAGGIQELSFDEIDQVGGGARAVTIVIKFIDWVGRLQAAQAIVDAVSELDSTEIVKDIGDHEQRRRPGAGG